MVSHNFELERGQPKEETQRENIDLKEFKEITNFNKTKELLENITLEIPKETELKDIKKFMINKNEKILNDIIKPKEEMIKDLFQENVQLHAELSKQAQIVDVAEKYQNERDKIIADNANLNNKVQNIEKEYKKKSNNLDYNYENRKDELEKEYKEKSFDLESKYHNKIHKLEKENTHLHKIVDKFYEIIDKFIHWICKKFDIAEEDSLVREFQKETNTFIYPEKQIKHEEREKEWEIER